MASDNFNRANETPLAAPWTKNGGTGNFNLVSNGVQASVSDDKYYYYAGAVSSPDQYSQATMVSAPSSQDWGPAVRIGGAGHTTTPEGYFFDVYIGGSSGGVQKHVNGAFTIIAATASSVAPGDTLRIEVEGTALRGYKNGVLLTSTTDTSLASAGNGVGFFIYETGGSIDDWSGGDLTAPPATAAGQYGWGTYGGGTYGSTFGASGTAVPGVESFSLNEGASVLVASSSLTDSATETAATAALASLLSTVDSAVLTDVSALATILLLAASDSYALSESSSYSSAVAVIEAYTFSDASSIGATLATTETGTLTDLSSLLQTNQLTAVDALTLLEAVIASEFSDKTANDSLTLTDSSSSTQQLNRFDTWTLSDASVLAATLSLVDSWSLSDASALLQSIQFATSDTMTISDVVLSLLDSKSLNDQLTQNDSASLLESQFKAGADSQTLTDGGGTSITFGANIGTASKPGTGGPDYVVLTTTSDVPAGAATFLNVTYYRDDGVSLITGVTDDGPGLAWNVDYDPDMRTAPYYKRTALIRAHGAIPAGTNITVQATTGADVWLAVDGYYLTGVANALPIDVAAGWDVTGAGYAIGPVDTEVGGLALTLLYNDSFATPAFPTSTDTSTLISDFYQVSFGWRDNSFMAVTDGDPFSASGTWDLTGRDWNGILVSYAPATAGGAAAIDAAANTAEMHALTELAQYAGQFTVTDKLSQDDVAALTSLFSASDTLTLSESATLANVITSLGDLATQTEGTTGLSQWLDRSDILTASEISSVSATLTALDSLILTDLVFSSGQELLVFGSDSASFSELSSLLTQTLIVGVDSLTQSDASLLAPAVSAADSLTLGELAAINATLAGVDTLGLLESLVLSTQLTGFDLVTASDNASVLASLDRLDNLTESEFSEFVASVVANEAAVISSELSILASVLAADSTLTTEQAELLLNKTAVDAWIMEAVSSLSEYAGSAPMLTLPTSVMIRFLATAAVIRERRASVGVVDAPQAAATVADNGSGVLVKAHTASAELTSRLTSTEL